MIRFIAAIDSKKGIADDNGIPWKGKLPSDVAYYRGKVKYHNYLIGYGTYAQHTKPLEDTPTFVASNSPEKLREGFTKVTDARSFLESQKEDIWVGGGAVLFNSLIDLADELYLTRIENDFRCTKFFPDFEDKFRLVQKSEPQSENDINFTFDIWERVK